MNWSGSQRQLFSLGFWFWVCSWVCGCVTPSPYIEASGGQVDGQEVALFTAGAYFPVGENRQSELESNAATEKAVLLDLRDSIDRLAVSGGSLDTLAGAFETLTSDLIAATEASLEEARLTRSYLERIERSLEEDHEQAEAERKELREFFKKWGPEGLLTLMLLGGGGMWMRSRKKKDDGE